MAEFRKRDFSGERRTDAETEMVKVPPHSIEAEQSVLGGLMLDNQAWDKVSEKLVEEDFYRKDHRLIFRAMATLTGESKPLDFITVSEYLERMGELEEAGGLAYLADLAKNTPSAANIQAYAEIVRERAVVRDMIGVANEIAEAGYRPQGRNSAELLDEAESKVFKIAESRDKKGQGPRDLKSILGSTLDRIDELIAKGGNITGLSTGFADLDKMTSGLQNQDLIIVAARPSMGKTTFSMNLVEHIAISSGKPVVVYSMEMPAESIMMRSLSSLSRVDQTRIRTGQLDDEDWAKLTSTINILSSQGKLFIDDSPGLSPTEVRSRARRIAREHGDLGLVMVDYLQLMQVPGMSDNRTLEISEISRSLKALAKEMNCPVIALSQLNRSLEQRADKRPVMSDLRESGAIEQDADIIMFIYRDEVYNPETPDKGTAEIIIAKQRNGPIGKVRLTFQGKYTRFDNFTSGEGFEGGW